MTAETKRTEGMRALTLHRPWSFAVAHLQKDVENRGWRTNYRGLLAIHAGKTWDWPAAEMIERIIGQGLFVPWEDERHPDAWKGIIAVANLTGCHEARPETHSFDDVYRAACCYSPWAQKHLGTWHWVLADVHPLPTPVACKGRQGLWTLPADVEREVRAQMEAGTCAGK